MIEQTTTNYSLGCIFFVTFVALIAHAERKLCKYFGKKNKENKKLRKALRGA